MAGRVTVGHSRRKCYSTMLRFNSSITKQRLQFRLLSPKRDRPSREHLLQRLPVLEVLHHLHYRHSFINQWLRCQYYAYAVRGICLQYRYFWLQVHSQLRLHLSVSLWVRSRCLWGSRVWAGLLHS